MRLAFLICDIEGGSWDDLTLASCTSLQSLTLTISLSLSISHRHFEYWQQVWHAALSVLSSAPLSIVSVTFDITCPCPVDISFLHSVDWLYLNQVLSRLGSLEKVDFSFRMQDPQMPPMQQCSLDYVKTQLGMYDQMGVLRIVQGVC